MVEWTDRWRSSLKIYLILKHWKILERFVPMMLVFSHSTMFNSWASCRQFTQEIGLLEMCLFSVFDNVLLLNLTPCLSSLHNSWWSWILCRKLVIFTTCSIRGQFFIGELINTRPPSSLNTCLQLLLSSLYFGSFLTLTAVFLSRNILQFY